MVFGYLMALLGSRIMWRLFLVRLGTVLTLTQDRRAVWAKSTVGSEIVLDAPDGTLGDVGHVESCLVRLETMLLSVQDRCTLCAKRNIGT
jgi:hypothetical protein